MASAPSYTRSVSDESYRDNDLPKSHEALLAKLSATSDATTHEARVVGERAEAVENAIKKWEESLNTIGDDAQLANVDLQNVLQKQQQTLQMLSNISKMLWDTASSVIRKIGG
jgi:hypothetical protein